MRWDPIQCKCVVSDSGAMVIKTRTRPTNDFSMGGMSPLRIKRGSSMNGYGGSLTLAQKMAFMKKMHEMKKGRGNVPVSSIGMTCNANQKRHLITKQCICIKPKTRCKWDSAWSEVECECKKRDSQWITTTRKRSIETNRLKWMLKYKKP
jgi:hypothetical protein